MCPESYIGRKGMGRYRLQGFRASGFGIS